MLFIYIILHRLLLLHKNRHFQQLVAAIGLLEETKFSERIKIVKYLNETKQ